LTSRGAGLTLGTKLTTSLLCGTCGKPASHVHFIPWIEQPARVELACEQHEPGGDEGEWYTLDEVAGEPGFRLAVERATAAPDALRAWLAANDAPAEPPSSPLSSEPGAPLTVEQAALRERVSTKTIYRRVNLLAADGGAWRAGEGKGSWRIDPAALDRLRVHEQEPQRRPRERPKTSDAQPRRAKAKPSNPTAWNRP
jgi:hypothetical protein